jgi:uncharacterized secreted protein with C-terminal beta-propeller domain
MQDGAAQTDTAGGVLVVVVAALLVGAAVGGGAIAATQAGTPTAQPPEDAPGTETGPNDGGQSDATAGNGSLVAFTSADDFRAYLRRAPDADDVPQAAAEPRAQRAVRDAEAGGDDGGPGDVTATPTAVATATPTPMATPAPTAAQTGGDGSAGGTGIDRQSTTNVQVAGVDEPDRVKTAGATTAYALRGHASATTLVNTSDPSAPAVASHVAETGRLLLVGDRLLVFTGESVVGYGIADRSEPERLWARSLNGSLAAARYVDGTVYLVVESDIDRTEPCPVAPLEGAVVDCDGVYHPREPAAADVTYSVVSMDAANGTTGEAVSFVASARTAATYVSRSGVYVTYVNRTGEGERYLKYLSTQDDVALPASVRDRLEELRSYDLGQRARVLEARRAVRSWVRSLPDREADRVRDELRSGYRDYREAHKRDLVRTGIVQVEYGDGGLSMGEVGSVPGVPLNQFSLSEHDGHLRVATTVAPAGTASVNDLYVLDSDLEVVGSVTGMGETERVYAVRFVGDTGYVVTYRRVDPFHVIDLSDPTDPTLEGELKLPGFSSYLHPLAEDRVLGIGEEDGRVKAVVFDVSDPTDPTVADDRVLDARWSAVAESHHAFLLDRKHGVFFLPTGQGGLVYGYEDGLTLRADVDIERASRAIYLNDYLYVFGRETLAVVDERDWERVATVDLADGVGHRSDDHQGHTRTRTPRPTPT